MPTARGSVSQAGANRITAQFILDDGRRVTYSGSVSTSVPRFNAATCVMTYNDEYDLTGTHPFTGLVGVTNIALTIGVTVTIAGTLDQQVAPAQTINGSGSWLMTRSDE